jgi:hypothetical protein
MGLDQRGAIDDAATRPDRRESRNLATLAVALELVLEFVAELSHGASGVSCRLEPDADICRNVAAERMTIGAAGSSVSTRYWARPGAAKMHGQLPRRWPLP